MKKLLIVGAFVLSASFVQAASVLWSGYGVSTSEGVATDSSQWTVTLMDSSKTSIEALNTAFSSGTLKSISEAIEAGKVGTASITTFGTAKSFSATAAISDTSKSFYVLFTDTATISDNSSGHYVVTAAQTVKTSDLGSGELAFGDVSTATSNWTVYSTGSAPIPEPTSAMLLMLGMAGLALRRRARKA